MGSEEFDRAKELWAQANWEPDEEKKKELAHQIVAVFDELLADETQPDKAQRAAVYNLRGLAYTLLGDAEHLQLARRDYKRALKLNSRMGQARKNLEEVNKALLSRDVAAKNAKLEQRRLKYCCGCVPRCKKGPWKPKPKMVRVHAHCRVCLHVRSRLILHTVTSILVGGLRRSRVCKDSEENTPAGTYATTDLRCGWGRPKRSGCTTSASTDIVGLARQWLYSAGVEEERTG